MIAVAARRRLLRAHRALLGAAWVGLLLGWAQLAPAQIVATVFPASAEVGTAITLFIAGGQTSWEDPGGAFVIFSGDGITVRETVPLSDNSLQTSIVIAGTATPGERAVAVAASGLRTDSRQDFPLEIATGGAFTVVAAPAPSERRATGARLLAVLPARIERGTTFITESRDNVTLSSEFQQMVITGANTNFEISNSIVTFSGTGISYDFRTDTLAVTPTSIIIRYAIEAGAPLGNRDVTVVTGRADAAETLTLQNAFTVVENDNFDLSRLEPLGFPLQNFAITESLRAVGLKSEPLTNRQSVRTGEEITLSTRVFNTGPATTVDFYVAVELPDGRVMFLAPDGQAFVPRLSPMAQGINLPGSFPPTTLALFSTVVDHLDPGVFTIYTAFTQPGTLEPLGEIGMKRFLVLGDLEFSGDAG